MQHGREFQHRIELVEDLPGDDTVLPVERDGALVWLIRQGQMTERLQGEFNTYLQFWAHCQLSAQRWSASGVVPEPEGAEDIAWVRFDFVDHLDGGVLVKPVRADGGFVWQVLKGEMTEQLAREVEEWLASYLKLGFLVLRRRGVPGREPPQP